jgi:hypothetical protein
VPAGEGVSELAGHALAPQGLGARDAVGVQDERGGRAGDELGDSAQRVGVLEGRVQLGVEDGVGVAGLAAAGLADWLLALAVGPAGAVPDRRERRGTLTP